MPAFVCSGRIAFCKSDAKSPLHFTGGRSGLVCKLCSEIRKRGFKEVDVKGLPRESQLC